MSVKQLGSMVVGECFRITVLTERLIRMEYNADGDFEDRRTRLVENRDFDTCDYTLSQKKDGSIEVATSCLRVIYDGKSFSSYGLQIQMLKNPYVHLSTWYYGDNEFLVKGNLKGTASTLDKMDGDQFYAMDNLVDQPRVFDKPNGKLELEPGLMSRSGFSVLDDSGSLVLTEDGDVISGLNNHKDIYFFCYGRDYYGCLKDYYHLSGHTPMLPKYALGNWWSRYYKYTQDEYINLMERFRQEGIPFSVSVIDMDWHEVDIPEEYGNGWTGYTWNKKLFPDHVTMLEKLHNMGKKVTLNVHPADGIRAHEDCYERMAEFMGLDPSKKLPVSFDITDDKFAKGYFECVHHPLEAEGVDFWWIDWQQGTNCGKKGMDPLWMLNYLHYEDSKRDGKRGLLFSRYAGPGSHRYPVGFSGDTVISWKSLDYQPYFTATASNIGYGWWSHDIGGHMRGQRDDELSTRWYQFGVFSPIMRLHSSSNRFSGKEPWKYSVESYNAMKKFLRLRHMMIPYLFTMNKRAHSDDIPLIVPMYYDYPEQEESYICYNEYMFGSQMLVHPITKPADECTRMGMTKTWLPKGIWVDLFTGMSYRGDRVVKMHRDLSSIPVLAKCGSIIPLIYDEDVTDSLESKERLELLIVPGADTVFTMYDDNDGIDCEIKSNSTRIELVGKQLIIYAPVGNTEDIPLITKYRVVCYCTNVEDISDDNLWRKGNVPNTVVCEFDFSKSNLNDKHYINLPERKDTKQVISDNHIINRIEEMLTRAQAPYAIKNILFEAAKVYDVYPEKAISNIDASYACESLKDALKEILMAM